MAMPIWLREKLFQKSLISKSLREINSGFNPATQLLFAEHHQSHAASAFFPSPFEEAVVLTMDGVGEWATTSCCIGKGNNLETIREIYFPHSIGLLYSAFTYYLGFKVNSGEYKVMGLAPYGEPKYVNKIFDHLLDLKEDGSFRLDQSYFNYCTGLTMTNKRFHSLFGLEPRRSNELLTQSHMDLAASCQAATEEVILRLTRALAVDTGCANLCLAGGVALNCVANGKIQKDGAFANIWVQPAAGDAGGAIGAAYGTYHLHEKRDRVISTERDSMSGSYLGPAYQHGEIEECLRNIGAVFSVLDEETLLDETIVSLVAEHAVGWFQGRMEFGPRALGARSILGDPRSPAMQKNMNLKVKFRESFRPFAPSILSEDVSDWFEFSGVSPYMLMVADVKTKHRKVTSGDENDLFGIEKLNIPRSSIPAVTHVDYSSRIQTVHSDTNPRYHSLIRRFKQETGCPVLLNTSFNIRGEPIVCTPEDAFRCFMGTEIETLVIGNCFLKKDLQDQSKKVDYSSNFELD